MSNENNLSTLKYQAAELIDLQNKIVATVWKMEHQIAQLEIDKKHFKQIQLLDLEIKKLKQQLDEQKFIEKISVLLASIEAIEKQKNPNFNFNSPYSFK